MFPAAASDRSMRTNADDRNSITNPSSSHSQTTGLGARISASEAFKRDFETENGTTTRFRASGRAGSKKKGIVCWLEPAPLPTSTAVFIAAGSQGFDATAIPPWFTNVDRSLPSDFANVLLLERARLRGRLSGWQHRTSASSDKLSSKPAERSP